MENIGASYNPDLLENKSEQKINLFKSYPQLKINTFSSDPKKHNISNKYFNGNKKFLKNKRKDKRRNKIKMPETPHNTGQYLSHIHQEFEPKRKTSSQLEKGIDYFEFKEANSFDEDLDDLDFDYEFINDKKRDRLMSLEGKDMHDFLFKSNETGNEDSNNLIKSCIDFNETKADNNDLDLQNSNSNQF